MSTGLVRPAGDARGARPGDTHRTVRHQNESGQAVSGRERRRERREGRDATCYQMHAQGNFVEHEYSFERDGDKVAEVSMR